MTDFRTGGWRNVAPAMISDEALMLEFRGGSQQAFEELFRRHRGPLYGFFRRRLNGDKHAEDLAQETFLAVIRASSRYEPRASVRTYLYAIAMNLLTAERRKQFRDSPSEEIAPEAATHEDSDSVLWIRQALERIADSEREILMLREYEQLSYAEIAELLKIPVNTVRSRLFRSRMALKGYLAPEREQVSRGQTSSNPVATGEVEASAKLSRAEGEAI
jgi:RNA polymerase sigma-70 factor (ECF subfamily)